VNAVFPRLDADLLDTDRHQQRPQQIGELRRGEQHPERNPGNCPLRRERESEVADEHIR
jgi:hypothetical protein